MAALGRLAIAVEADIASFTSDMGKADRVAKRTAADMERSLNRTFQAIGAAAAVAGVAVAAMVKKSIDAADQAAKMAQKIGISVEALSGYRFAADQAGVSVEQLQTGLVRLSRSAADAAGGLKQQQAVFRALGISVTDASGKLRSTEALFVDVAEAFSKMEDSAGKTALATRVFGKAGADLIPLLNSGRDGLSAYADEAERLGLVMSTDTAKAAETFNDNLSKLMDSVGGLGYALASEFLPYLVDATNAMVEWVKQIRESGALERAIEWIKAFISVLDELAVFIATKVVAGALLGFISALGKLTAAIGAARVAATGFAAVQAALAGPIGLIASAIGIAVAYFVSLETAETDAERVTRQFTAALDASEKVVSSYAGAKKDLIAAEVRSLQLSGEIIRSQLEQAQATLAAAEAEAELGRQRRANAAASGGMGMRAFGGNANAVGDMYGAQSYGQEGIDKARGDVEQLMASLLQTNATAMRLNEILYAPQGDGKKNIIVDLTDAAGKATEEMARVRDEAESFANQTIMAMVAQFDPLLAIQLRYEESLRNLAPLLDGTAEGERLYAEALAAVVRMKDADVAAARKQIAETKKQQNVVGNLAAAYAEEAMVMRMSAREAFVYAETQRAIGDAIAANRPLMADQIDQIGEMAGEMFDSTEEFEKIQDILSEFGDNDPFVDLIDKIKYLRAEIEELPGPMDEAFDPERVAQMQRALGNLRQETLMYATDAIGQGISSLKSMTTEGSNAYKALEVAQAALNLTTAIGAIVNQGMGDPYTAFARMAAMAAAVSQLVGSIGSFGGGFTNTAQQRQDVQGTGSVLGDADAKSESMLNATEITADATSKLVGINRGMLSALLALQSGISNATVMLARGAGEATFSALPRPFDFSAGSFGAQVLGMPSLANMLLGGSSRVTDQGLHIGGGSISDIDLSAYQEVQSRSWRFGSRRTRTSFADVEDEFENQFQLIIDSIVGTVREGALALGLLPEEIEAAIEAFQLAEINISLMDLTAEEQQAELEAVFSQIFDDLAGHVVPFIAQFQQVGEGLGETLVRVATSVQVVQEAIRYLGLAIDETDPERFAQISVGLIEAVGGIEEFIEGMTTFVSAFATDEHRLMVATDELNRAFEQVGLEVPATRDAMWALMQSLDATTEEGQEQIATLLRLAGVADQYYDLLEDAAEQAQEAAENAAAAFDEINALLTNLATDGWSDPLQSIIDLDAEYQEHVATIQELARANGRAEASEAELTFARQWHARKLEQLSQQILRSAQQLAAQLGYAGFEEFGADNDPVYDAEMGGIGAVEQAVEDRYARELQLLEQLDQYVRGLGISNLSPLNPTERLGEAQAEYERILALAQGGDLDALAQLQGAANAYLTEAQGYYGGVGAYEGIFESVRMALAGLVSAGPQNEQIGPNTPVFGGPVSVTPSSEMVAQNAIERALLAQQLVDHLAALSVALNAPILELMETLGIPIAQLAEDLGINIEQITGASVEALAQLAMDLGLPLGQLVDALGLNLPGLADGVRELAAELGYNVQELVNETGTGLLNLAQYLGADLAELAESLGQDLGALTDANSPIFLALEDTIDALSPDIRDQLQPYLTAITSATNEADANAAIGEAEAAINALPVGIRDLLAPFFAGVDPPGALSDLDYLSNIDGGIVALIEIMEDIAEQMGVNGYAQGTPFVPSNQMAFLHKGEMVIPASVADRVRNGDYYLGSGESMNSSGDSSALERKVEQLIKQNGELLSAIAQNTKVTANEMTKQKPPGYRNAA